MEIVNELNKKPKISGVTGFGHWSFIEQIIGRRDAKSNQIWSENGIYTTPWIEYKYNFYSGYINATYLKLTARLEKVYSEVYSKAADLKLLKKGVGYPEGLTGEQAQRIKLKCDAKAESDKRKKEEILVRLAGIKAELETVDAALNHNIERAEHLLKTHVGFYWKGILKSASEQMPSYPNVAVNAGHGREVYEAHMKDIFDTLNESLKDGGW